MLYLFCLGLSCLIKRLNTWESSTLFFSIELIELESKAMCKEKIFLFTSPVQEEPGTALCTTGLGLDLTAADTTVVLRHIVVVVVRYEIGRASCRERV